MQSGIVFIVLMKTQDAVCLVFCRKCDTQYYKAINSKMKYVCSPLKSWCWAVAENKIDVIIQYLDFFWVSALSLWNFHPSCTDHVLDDSWSHCDLCFVFILNNTSSCLFSGVISLTSNIVVLLMFLKFRELRTATNFIIINLAFTDVGVAGIGYPMSAASDIHGSWKFGYTGCQVGRMWVTSTEI